jgi:hypothetical protein
MTVTQLIKQLEKLRAKHGNLKVCVDRDDIEHALNGVGTVVSLAFTSVMWVGECDGDGFTVSNKDGTERGRNEIVLAHNNFWLDRK